jgi:hypothetical protein
VGQLLKKQHRANQPTNRFADLDERIKTENLAVLALTRKRQLVS